MNAIDTIINEISQQIPGSSCIPETYEAAFVSTVWERAQAIEALFEMSCFIGRASLRTR